MDIELQIAGQRRRVPYAPVNIRTVNATSKRALVIERLYAQIVVESTQRHTGDVPHIRKQNRSK